MARMAALGSTLDAAVRDVTRDFHRLNDRRHDWLGRGLALVVVVFAVGTTWIAGRIRSLVDGPLSELTGAADRFAAGDEIGRAPERGPRELRRLAFALNAALERHRSDQALLAERNRELTRRAERLAETQRTARLGSWTWHLDTHEIEWSAEMHRILGTDPSSYEPHACFMKGFVAPEDQDRLAAARSATLAGEPVEPFLLQIERADGERRWVRAQIALVAHGLDEDGPGHVVQGTLHDVTDIVMVEQELDAERRLSALAGRVGRVGGWSVDLTTGVQHWSDMVTEIHETPQGYVPDVENSIRFYAPWARPVIREAFDHAILEGEPYDLELQIDTAGGRRIWVRAVGEAARDDEGRIVRIEGAFQDIDARKAREEGLEVERRLNALANRLGRVGGWSLDVDRSEPTWSDVVREVHELPADFEPSVERGVGFYAPWARPIIQSAVERAMREGETYDLELELDTATGRRIWVRTIGQPRRDGEGRIVALESAFQDIDARKRSEERAQRIDRRLREVLEALPDGFVAIDADGRPSFVNDAARSLLGHERREDDAPLWDLLPSPLDAEIGVSLRRAVSERRSETFVAADVPRDRWLAFSVEPAGEELAVIVRDVSERERLTSQLLAREAELVRARDQLEASLAIRENLMSGLPAHVALVDSDGTILEVNERWREFGRDNDSSDPTYGKHRNYLEVARAAAGDAAEAADEVASGLAEVLNGERELLRVEYPCHAPDRERWFLLEARPVPATDGGGTRAVVMHVDVTKEHEVRERLERLAFEDTLTGLANREGFVRELDAFVSGAWPNGHVLASLDVRDMSAVNELYGFEAGDALLRSIADRLAGHPDLAGPVARVGGDEFVVLVAPSDAADGGATGNGTGDATDRLRHVVRDAVEAPHDLTPELRIAGEAHVGLTRLGDRPRPARQILREAQLALFEGSSAPGAVWTEYDRTLDHRVHDRMVLAEELRVGIERDELRLHFHPEVFTRTGELFGAEALVRWDHPERGLLGPGAFIPLAEQTGLITALGAWVLNEACRKLAAWSGSLGLARVAVNVSSEELVTGTYADTVLATLARHGVAPGMLTLEVTESVFARKLDVVAQQLRTLRDAGVKIALDDFGTGYTSLGYLKTFPFDHVKLDKIFVADMLTDPYSRGVITSVVNLAEMLGASVIAEGVETDEQRRMLIDLRCEISQGFYFCLPLDEEDFEWLLKARQPLPLTPTA